MSYDKNDPLTFCGWCQAEKEGQARPNQTTGICGKHAGELLDQAREQLRQERGDFEEVEVLARVDLRNRVATMRDLERPASSYSPFGPQDQADEEERHQQWKAAAEFVGWVIGGAIILGIGVLLMVVF